MKFGPVYWAFHSLIWGNLAFYVSIFFSIIFECYPVWQGRSPTNQGQCTGSKTLLVISGAVNVVSDLLIILLPVWTTWHLQMTPKRKAGVTAMFSTGFLYVSSLPQHLRLCGCLSSRDNEPDPSYKIVPSFQASAASSTQYRSHLAAASYTLLHRPRCGGTQLLIRFSSLPLF